LDREGLEEETVGPRTRAEHMMGTDWALMWKHPQGVDRCEGPPLYRWIRLVVPVHSLLARGKYISCEPKSYHLLPARDQLPELRGVNFLDRQRIGSDWQQRWMMNSKELMVPQVMERYCQPRAVDTHPAIGIKHLISNLLTMNKPAHLNPQQFGTTQPGPMGQKREQTPGSFLPRTPLEVDSREIDMPWGPPDPFPRIYQVKASIC